MKEQIKEGLEKIVDFSREIGKFVKKNGKIATLLLAGSINSIVNGEISTLRIENHSSSVPGSFMVVYHVDGATNNYGDLYDALYPDFNPNPLHIYSYLYSSDIKLKADARDSNHITNPQDPNTFINIELYNKGFQGTTNNSLEFVISKKYHFNFDWKNIFFKINSDIFDIKYLINNGEFDPFFDTNVGKIELEELDGSRTGIYNTGNVEFYNHCDLNRDRLIDGLDFEIFRENFGRDNETDPNTFGSYVGSDVNDVNAYTDINRSGGVDFDDLDVFKTYFRFPGDLDGNGRVDNTDFAYFAPYWGARDVNSISDVSGPNGIPDKNVDFYDLGAFTSDYLRDINEPSTW